MAMTQIFGNYAPSIKKGTLGFIERNPVFPLICNIKANEPSDKRGPARSANLGAFLELTFKFNDIIDYFVQPFV